MNLILIEPDDYEDETDSFVYLFEFKRDVSFDSEKRILSDWKVEER